MNRVEKILSENGNMEEFSDYVHHHFQFIVQVMIKELGREWKIDNQHKDYGTVLFSIIGRMFNEMVYFLCASTQGSGLQKFKNIIPPLTREIMKDLLNNKTTHLEKSPVTKESYRNFYKENIERLYDLLKEERTKGKKNRFNNFWKEE